MQDSVNHRRTVQTLAASGAEQLSIVNVFNIHMLGAMKRLVVNNLKDCLGSLAGLTIIFLSNVCEK